VTVLVVGGGPAGAAVATHLARSGIEVVLAERRPAYRWRASGVFSSPATLGPLRDLGLTTAELERIARPIPAMRLETPAGAVVRLTYGADAGPGSTQPTAVGFDRSALDPRLLDLARAEGVDVRLGVTVEAVELDHTGVERVRLHDSSGVSTMQPRIVVGADGRPSVVARAAGVERATWLAPRVGLSHHRPDDRGDGAVDARMRLLDDGYVGIAPVPGDRVNIGIVLGPRWRTPLRRDGALALADAIVDAIPEAPDDPGVWRAPASGRPDAERLAGASPLGGRVTRRTGPGWVLVGDAAGFLDPFTGEGLHRALVSAELGAAAVRAALDGSGSMRGRRRRAGGSAERAAFAAYERAMQRRFVSKDAVSWLVQQFLARPGLLEYAARRLAARPAVRATMGLVMGDLIPASRGLDPRFLAALLVP
jgi:flavin-dependent dehydrogenase